MRSLPNGSESAYPIPEESMPTLASTDSNEKNPINTKIPPSIQASIDDSSPFFKEQRTLA
jgi:hypothetical protein